MPLWPFLIKSIEEEKFVQDQAEKNIKVQNSLFPIRIIQISEKNQILF
jgi:hypothetical protein